MTPDITFPVTEQTVEIDGQPVTFKAGHVIRLFNKDDFEDTLILGFSAPQPILGGDVIVRLARPHAYVVGVGTTCPDVTVMVERYTAMLSTLVEKKCKPINNYPRVFACV